MKKRCIAHALVVQQRAEQNAIAKQLDNPGYVFWIHSRQWAEIAQSSAHHIFGDEQRDDQKGRLDDGRKLSMSLADPLRLLAHGRPRYDLAERILKSRDTDGAVRH